MANLAPLQYIPSKTAQPLPVLNPTRAGFRHVNNRFDSLDTKVSGETTESDQAASDIGVKWTSRNNRKGRHALVVKPSNGTNVTHETPPYSDTYHEVCKGIQRMVTCYPVWDISWLVAYIFFWGSLIWLINAFFVFLPWLEKRRDFSGLILYGGSITAFIGATLFEIGSILLLVEAFNANQSGCFGWAIERVLEHDEHGMAIVKATPDKHSCDHHHTNKNSLIRKPPNTSTDAWTWWPTRDQLRKHYIRDLGFLAAIAELLGSSTCLFGTITGLPGIYTRLHGTVMSGVYWLPQLIGGVLFLIAGILFMVETQKTLFRPAPKVLGWHIGLWNIIGGLGFVLFTIFALDKQDRWARHQAACSTLWASWAFLLGSVLQWYEALNKHPVERAW